MKLSYTLTGAVAALALVAPLFTGTAVAQQTIELTLWSRADNSGPLRPGNILKGADRLNEQLAAEGADFRVQVNVLEQPGDGGYDGDAERMLRAFAIGDGPDLFHAAHEWICAFADSGFAYDLTDFTQANPDLFGDIFPSLWALDRMRRPPFRRAPGRRGAHVLLQQGSDAPGRIRRRLHREPR